MKDKQYKLEDFGEIVAWTKEGKPFIAYRDNKKVDVYELCIICNKETPYTTDTHINQRHHYVEGSGQLCCGCWDNKAYPTENKNV